MDPMSEATFQEQLDELRCHDTSWVRQERARVVTEQRRLKVRELALTKVLDERDALDPMPDASIPAHTAKSMTEVARSLESLPALAQSAATGELSWEQLDPSRGSRLLRRIKSGRGEGATARRWICRSGLGGPRR